MLPLASVVSYFTPWTYATGRNREEECDKRYNNFVWNKFSPNFPFLETDLFVKGQKTLILSEDHTT